MPAMTMPFVVLEKDAALLQRVGPGDEVTATLVAPDSRYWLEDLVVVKKGTPDPNAHAGAARPRAAARATRCRTSPSWTRTAGRCASPTCAGRRWR